VLQALKAAQIPAASVAVVVHPVDAGAPLVAHNAARPMNPASVMKLVTTYAALDLLGPAYTWKTTVWTENPAVDGNLSGNLYLRGSGDPRFAIEHLTALLRQIQARGISISAPCASRCNRTTAGRACSWKRRARACASTTSCAPATATAAATGKI
jgi:D-alanyl-D-alanine carboxypeptidase